METLSKEDIESLGWECTDDSMALNAMFYRLQTVLGKVYEMRYNPASTRMSVIQWPSSDPILECKISSRKELKQEMMWCEIPITEKEQDGKDVG